MEYRRKLFKWKPGTPEWINTGLIDTGKRSDDGSKDGFKLAVSAETVYVGKRDGKLFQSLDGGDSWRDITASLPLHFTQFNEIVFAGSTVYVATDRGVLVSRTGAHWSVLTDGAGDRVVIDKFAADDISVYGVGNWGVERPTGGRSSDRPPSIRSKIVCAYWRLSVEIVSRVTVWCAGVAPPVVVPPLPTVTVTRARSDGSMPDPPIRTTS